MKNVLIIVTISLTIATIAQAATPRQNFDSFKKITRCPEKADVQKAFNDTFGDMKGEIARKLGLPVSQAMKNRAFAFEGYEISRIEQRGNNCDVYVPQYNYPIYTLTIK